MKLINKNIKNNDKHDQEHAKWNRRSFLQALGLVGSGTILIGKTPVSAMNPTRLTQELANSNSDRVLVIIRLKGGNDGLNTVIPAYDYSTYASIRPNIKINNSDSFALSNEFRMPNYMQDLQNLWNNDKMKIVHGVGYPDQNLSHFTSSDIWSSAGSTTEQTQTGIFGRYFENIYPDYLLNAPDIPPAIQIGSLSNLMFSGDNAGYAFSVANPDQLQSIAQSGVAYDVQNLPNCTYGDQLGWIRSIVNTTYTYANIIHQAYNNGANDASYNNSDISKQLAIVARLIKGNLGTKIYMVTLDGFDTHAEEAPAHQQLMLDLTNSINQFFNDLDASGVGQNVLAMTISEFGRRPEENGSLGTDHGAANTMMLFGEGLNGSGFTGTHPDFANLDSDGNLQHTTDFRSVYAAILEDWLCIDSQVVNDTLFQNYTRADIGVACDAANYEDYSFNQFIHIPIYKNDSVYVQFELKNASSVSIELFNVLGKSLGKIYNKRNLAGKYKVDLNPNRLKHTIGQYFYQINVGGKKYSKSFVFIQ
jgi:uncharacterized protein (DUF1501 family)